MSAPRLASVAVLFDFDRRPDPLALRRRGNHAVYRPESNPCPGCGRTHWQVGRTMAECAVCETALPIADHGRKH